MKILNRNTGEILTPGVSPAPLFVDFTIGFTGYGVYPDPCTWPPTKNVNFEVVDDTNKKYHLNCNDSSNGATSWHWEVLNGAEDVIYEATSQNLSFTNINVLAWFGKWLGIKFYIRLTINGDETLSLTSDLIHIDTQL